MNQKASSLLIVEDDKDTCEILAAIIATKFPDFTVHVAGDGHEGLEQFSRYNPDIVITDINMPEINGLDLARMIRRIKPEVSIILMTADTGGAAIEAERMELEIRHCIFKPILYKELFSAIEMCIAGSP